MPLAGVGIALSVYSTVTKLFNVPLLSVATSSVATAYGDHEGKKLASFSSILLTSYHFFEQAEAQQSIVKRQKAVAHAAA